MSPVSFDLTGRVIIYVGSDASTDVTLADPSVSPKHCRVYNNDDGVTLFAIENAQVIVNGQYLGRASLHNGDLVQLAGKPAATGF